MPFPPRLFTADRVASQMLAAKVGSIRMVGSVFGSLSGEIDAAESDILERVARATGHQARSAAALARRAGESVSDALQERLAGMARSRVGAVIDRVKQASGVELRAPSRDPGVGFLGSGVRGYMGKAASEASERASAVIRDGGDPAAALRQLRARTRSVTASGVNAAHNSAVLAIARANRGSVRGVMAFATLDSRTTEICASRHGGAWDQETGSPLPESIVAEDFPGRPPWHHACRTTLVILLEGEDAPTLQTLEMDDWLDSDDAAEALGEEPLRLYREGVITRSQLVSMSD